jgi:hypothetical protein
MAVITQEQLKQIIQNAPTGSTPRSIVEGLLERGVSIEGLEVEPTAASSSTPKKTGLLSKVGQGIASVLTGGAGTADGTTGEVATGAIKGVVSSATNLLPILSGGTLSQTRSEQLVPEELRTPEPGAERAGFFAEQAAEFVAPSRAIAGAVSRADKFIDALKVSGQITDNVAGRLNTLFRGVAEGTAAAGVASVQEGEIGQEAAIAGVTGGVLGATAPSIGRLFRAFGGVGKRGAAGITGRGSDLIEQVVKTPESVLSSFGDDVVQGLRSQAQSVRSGVDDILRSARTEYGRAVSALPDTPLVQSADDIMARIIPTLEGRGVSITDDLLDFSGTPFDEAEERVLSRIVSRIKSWDDLSPEGLNNLAIKIGNFERPGQLPAVKGMIGRMKNDVRNIIVDTFDDFGAVNTAFGEEMNFINAVKSELSVKGAVDDLAGIQQTAKKIQTLFNSRKELARDLVEQLERRAGIEILGPEAARQLTGGVTRQQASIGGKITSIVEALISPEAVGRIVAHTGITTSQAEQIVQQLSAFTPQQLRALATFVVTEVSDLVLPDNE